MAGKKKIDLSIIPSLIQKEAYETIQVIDSLETFTTFVGNLRQDWYSKKELASKLNLFERAQKWFALDTLSKRSFYLTIDDPDEFPRNDNWGSVTLYECVAFEHGGRVVVSKENVKTFSH